MAKNNENVIYDIRFSSLPNSVEGLWGIKLDKNKDNGMHVEYITNRDNSPKDLKTIRYDTKISLINNAENQTQI